MAWLLPGHHSHRWRTELLQWLKLCQRAFAAGMGQSVELPGNYGRAPVELVYFSHRRLRLSAAQWRYRYHNDSPERATDFCGTGKLLVYHSWCCCAYPERVYLPGERADRWYDHAVLDRCERPCPGAGAHHL